MQGTLFLPYPNGQAHRKIENRSPKDVEPIGQGRTAYALEAQSLHYTKVTLFGVGCFVRGPS